MILFNGGLVISPHVFDDLGSARGTPSCGQRHVVRGKTGKLGPTEECNTSSSSVNKVILGRSWTASAACKNRSIFVGLPQLHFHLSFFPLQMIFYIGWVFWLYMECFFNILGNTSLVIVTYSFIKPLWQIYLDGPRWCTVSACWI